MTKKKDAAATPASMLAGLRRMIVDPGVTQETLLRALDLAYEIGKSEGHFDGARRMAEDLTAKFSKSLDKITLTPPESP